MTMDLVGGIVGAVLTVLILSYILGDNPLYRLALYVLIGASVGYVVAVVVGTVIFRVALPSLQQGGPQPYSLLVPVVLGVFLLLKGFPRGSALGNLSTGFLVGVGAAVAMGGALLGTIIPQVDASGSVFEWAQGGLPGLGNGLIVLVGTVCALLAFTFTVRQRRGPGGLVSSLVGFFGGIGRLFLLAAFGAVFGGALVASLTVLVGRIYFVVDVLLEAWRRFGG
ncbi:MAG TPA: hypothetical protein EYH27_00125 [Anaerolineales bacterium]|nr:hypothetical protein [Anaerolineae bacterium]HIP86827.1 hypothetical protein [Anaerolineales bacterium]